MLVRLFVTLAALFGLTVGLGAVGPHAPAAFAASEARGRHADVDVQDGVISRKRASKLAGDLESLAPRRVAVVLMAEAPDGVEAAAKARFRTLDLGPDDLAIAIATIPGQAAVHVGQGLRDRGVDRAAIAEVVARYFPRYAESRIPDLGAAAVARALVAYKPPEPREGAMPTWVAALIIGAVVGLPVLIGLGIRFGHLLGPTELPASGGSSSDPLEALRRRREEQRERERND